MNNDYKPRNGISFCEALTITFIILKLCHVIAWSWWLVLLPLFIQTAILTILNMKGIEHDTYHDQI